MVFRQAFLFVAAAGVLAGPPLTSAAQTEAETLVAAMQDGGKVIYLRHGATNQGEVDTGRLGDRAGQRNLSTAGIAQVKALGNAFRSLQIPMGQILASPVFRARDTGELAFGAQQIQVTMDLVADDYAGQNVRGMIAATRRLLRALPPPGDNRILIGHRTPLELVLERPFPDSVLPEGAMAVFVPSGPATEPRLLGTITAERLIQSATVRR
jgi:phosphohistidine phosphatase SixA